MIRLLALAAIVAAPALAQTQTQMTARAGVDYRAADAAMTTEWRRTLGYMKRLDAQDTSRGGGFGYAAAALASQRAWLQFRDSECAIESGQFGGGSAAPMVRGQCLARLSRARAAQLQSLRWPR